MYDMLQLVPVLCSGPGQSSMFMAYVAPKPTCLNLKQDLVTCEATGSLSTIGHHQLAATLLIFC